MPSCMASPSAFRGGTLHAPPTQTYSSQVSLWRPKGVRVLSCRHRAISRRDHSIPLVRCSLSSSSKSSALSTEAAKNSAPLELLEKSVNTIRFLSIDAVEKAKSGHPGLPMGCAPLGHILFDEFMRYNPKSPSWLNRDRFVLSAGHGCMLHYALLHLAGYDSVQVRCIVFSPFALSFIASD
eukprot:TRINITY_DN1436_c0_g1_i7.p1 TRINITY_DN1436_c0_g1~~TRINITY_DN1436_c0_g1_i7.p1  ORF type:complete len:181 (-),score=11.97 TRINITY_DN1436_c0_g1_i7:125-667(-)